MDYCLPGAGHVRFFHFETRKVRSTSNPIAIEGAREAGPVGSYPAVMNALDWTDAVRTIAMPATLR